MASNALREERARLYGEMRSLLDDTSERGMGTEEAEKYGEMESEVERLTADIEARDRADQLQERMEKPRPVEDAVVQGRSRQYTDEKREYARAFDRYLRGDRQAGQYLERAQSVGTPSEGGFTVPDEFMTRLVEVRKAFGGLANEAEVITTASGAPLEFPSLDDTSNLGDITSEAAAFEDGDDLVFGSVNLGAFKYTSTGGGTTTPLRVSYELLQDSEFDIAALISRKLGERISRKQAFDWVNGSGSGEPQGIAGSSITEDIDVDTHDTLDYDDLLELEGLLDPAYEPNAKWLMSKKTWNVVRAIVDGDSRPLVQANAEAGIGTRPSFSLLGYPVVVDQEMPDFPGTGDEHFLILGDLREAFIIRRVSGLTVVVNPFSRANNGQVEYTAWERADAAVQNRSAYKLLANTNS